MSKECTCSCRESEKGISKRCSAIFHFDWWYGISIFWISCYRVEIGLMLCTLFSNCKSWIELKLRLILKLC